MVVSAVQGSIYVFGGEQVPRTPLTDGVFRYDLGTETWHLVQVGLRAQQLHPAQLAAASALFRGGFPCNRCCRCTVPATAG